jgi:hypothetical protein
MESQALSAFQVNLRDLGQRPQVYVKLSALLRRVDGRVPQDLNFCRAKLDGLCSIFGENRLLYGSDWPNSDLWAPYEQLLNIFLQGSIGSGVQPNWPCGKVQEWTIPCSHKESASTLPRWARIDFLIACAIVAAPGLSGLFGRFVGAPTMDCRPAGSIGTAVNQRMA